MSEELKQNECEALNKGVMVDELMARLGKDFPSKAAAGRIVTEIFALMADSLAAGKPVRMQDFGSFEVYESAARMGRNPQTNEPVSIPASMRVKFSAARALKAAVNKQ